MIHSIFTFITLPHSDISKTIFKPKLMHLRKQSFPMFTFSFLPFFSS